MLNGDEKRVNAVMEVLEKMNGPELLAAWNEYASQEDPDNEIFYWEEFDELFGGQSASWIVDRIYYGDYKPNADLFTFNGYGNIVSVYWHEIKDHVDLDELAAFYSCDYIPSWVYVPAEIADALDELDEDEDA